ncbi:acyl-CoA synthase [Actinoplanes sp. ATCC 53533]|uniref:SCP2 sterol-binding domain-containing protein n=1 Tax=Actinoplanes sp. ATCC 53533 TaxID=1288362 RepID=UPI000F76D407|nr:SCP2 sterol-binding domain-containing protein [Actinoplanes sp. ATCC 53533]RSM47493.1 acyl-CoA synthase [Actinoplanes sp. ATCC 53533]
MTFEQGYPATLATEQFSRLIKQSTAGELAELMSGDRRRVILDEVFRRMPQVFRSDRAGELRAVVHWHIGDRPDGGADRYELTIADGGCSVSGQPDRPPQLTLSIGAVDFLRMATGNTRAVVLAMTGRLRSSGDLALAARMPRLLDPPRV